VSDDRAEHLRALLAELHETLEGAEPVDASLHEPLNQVLTEIREALEPGEAPQVEPTLSGRVSDLALHFEASHPTIAGTLNRLTHMLASMGI
jgi:hypothetical protein